ncbi:DUF4163 domain-containing protein [Bizionia gelidisalsuginis]|uniref:DUF4163 domain-containing protein n=2 Tax=Bizionia TaxID=283785 RepID=A0A8H2QFG8_9FLAO|nr:MULTISPECIES: DUF4163 domain-containing protein [Bizionia]TYB75971.1 DUF4163 domain-containing protein [Bizionia saleffrena]TYC13474.1 DUF4163 domain-containing protein [Bizionia gelidisalsuginis]
MFNSFSIKALKTILILVISVTVFSCKKETTLTFSTTSILTDNETVVEVNIPKAEGNTEAAQAINRTLENYTNMALTVDSANTMQPTIEDNITAFNASYSTFKTEIGKTLLTDLPSWEALVDGEISFQNESIICIVMNSSINTGGAQGIFNIKFFNFDATTGEELQTKDLITDVEAFTTLVKKHYDKELETGYEASNLEPNDAPFSFPENLGFSEDGVIIFYDRSSSLSNDPLEFTISYTIANKYLKF